MIDADVVRAEIAALEGGNATTYAVCEKLAMLYTVADHLGRASRTDVAERAATGGSDFLDACSGKPVDKVLAVIDEHMEAQRALYPKAYESVIRRLREI